MADKKKFSLKNIPSKMRMPLMLTAFVGIVAIVFAVSLFTGGSEKDPLPKDASGAKVGVPSVNPYTSSSAIKNDEYTSLRRKYEEERQQSAKKTGTSYLSPLDEPQTITEVSNPTSIKSPERRLTQGASSELSDKYQASRAQQKAAVMSAIFDANSDKNVSFSETFNDYLAKSGDKAEKGADGKEKEQTVAQKVLAANQEENESERSKQAQASAIADAQQDNPLRHKIRPGDIVYARLITGINSDEPSPVLAKVINGPLAGADLIGSAKRVGRAVIIEFKTMSSGRYTTAINAVAISTETARTAIATDVDRHILSRWGSLFLAGATKGAKDIVESEGTSQLNTNGSTTTTTGSRSAADIAIGALGGVGEEFSSILRKNFDRPPTVYVDPSVSMYGVLFLDVQDEGWIPSDVADRNPYLGQ